MNGIEIKDYLRVLTEIFIHVIFTYLTVLETYT